MDKLRERIAEELYLQRGFRALMWHDLSDFQKEVWLFRAAPIINLYKEWFLAEVDKLEVIGDAEITKALNKLIASPIVLKKPEKAIAKAQLQDIKKKLKGGL